MFQTIMKHCIREMNRVVVDSQQNTLLGLFYVSVVIEWLNISSLTVLITSELAPLPDNMSYANIINHYLTI